METFTKGQRVKVSECGKRAGLSFGKEGHKRDIHAVRGTVTAVTPEMDRLRVLVDGNVTVVSYSLSSWTDATTDAR
jgi:hypothetical protein